MHISKIYLGDNFVPDPQFDQYRRRQVHVEITLKEGEDLAEAESKGEEYIRDYIKRNSTQYLPQFLEQRGTEVKDVPEDTMEANRRMDMTMPKPTKEIKLRNSLDQIKEDIATCTDIKILESYKLISKSKPELTEAYNNKLKSLQNQPA